MLKISNGFFCREKPGEPEWQALADMKIPFLLNYSQCQLLMGNYYEVIEQCSQVLIRQPSKLQFLLDCKIESNLTESFMKFQTTSKHFLEEAWHI